MADIDRTSFLSGGNAEFIAELYTRYLEDPASVDPSWRRFFADIADDPAAIRAERAGPAWARPLPPILAPDTAAPMKMPWPLGIAAVPAALRPIQLPSMVSGLVPFKPMP